MADNALDYLIILVSDFIIATVQFLCIYIYIYTSFIDIAKVNLIVFMLFFYNSRVTRSQVHYF